MIKEDDDLYVELFVPRNAVICMVYICISVKSEKKKLFQWSIDES